MTALKGSGPAVCIGEDIDTDLVIAGRYLRTKDWSLWAKHVFEDLDPTLASRLQGSVLVAGKNMGCGSSREQAARALHEAGVLAVIAPSFARIFFRNCINVGLPVLECNIPECRDGMMVTFDCTEGWITVDGIRHEFLPLSSRMQEILSNGGLVEYWKRRLER
ncbi:3-isopropylmalate dehydratase [Methanospirillum purgamenti]|jgi:methanogen homoaconitase small subunit|uniref:3-isopropylmalate dehydratase n=1 Tax=Methanospirillum hungatei TaxID=2203 RepID=A0A8F5ZEF6_METHU|nr:3-isopropylmalate dehydratase [Methanospirillum hungatei]QXO94345.1 3-isopropylmalate dehydratase [Methanospirillum hungatei]